MVSGKYTRETNGAEVLYIYDRVCRKKTKQHEISEQYGVERNSANRKNRYAEYDFTGFAERQKLRANMYYASHPYSRSERRSTNTDGNSQAYKYEPSPVGDGDVKAEAKPLKLIIERIINLFDSIEDRRNADETIAKQKVIRNKRISEKKSLLIMIATVLLVAVLFVLIAYKLFCNTEKIEIVGCESYSQEELTYAAGIEYGKGILSFNSDRAESDITFRCPYIREAEIIRTLPSHITINTTEDEAVYCARIWNDYVMLSPSLRVLECFDAGDSEAVEKCKGLTELVLPPVSYSVAGRKLRFASARDERFIRDILSEVSQSQLAVHGNINKIELSDRYCIMITAMDKYLMKLGGEEDCALKLKVAYKSIQGLLSENSSPARMNLTTVGEASVKFDINLNVD